MDGVQNGTQAPVAQAAETPAPTPETAPQRDAPGVSAYSATPEQRDQVTSLIAALKGGRAGREAPAPALVPHAGPSETPARAEATDGPNQRQSAADAVRASIPAPATETVTLAAPGMQLPDPRVRDALSRRPRPAPTSHEDEGLL